MSVKDSAVKMVSLLKQIPADKVKHYASFKFSQIERYCAIGGLQVPEEVKKEMSLEEQKAQKLIQIDTKKLKRMIFADEDAKPDYQKDLFNADIISQQYKSLKNIHTNKWADYYKLSEKMTTPKGNPNYYTRLLKDVDQGGQKREGFLTAIKTVFTGRA